MKEEEKEEAAFFVLLPHLAQHGVLRRGRGMGTVWPKWQEVGEKVIILAPELTPRLYLGLSKGHPESC